MSRKLGTPTNLGLLSHTEIISNLNHFIENGFTTQNLCELLGISNVMFSNLKNKNYPISEALQSRCTILFKYNPDTKGMLFKIQSDSLKSKIEAFLKSYPEEAPTLYNWIYSSESTTNKPKK